MKTALKESITTVIADRQFLALLAAVATFGVVYCLYVLFSLQVRDVQVAVHYSAFGETHFYNDKWYYLVVFVLFGLFLTATHLAIMVKFYLLERAQIAKLYGKITLLILFIVLMYTRSILGIAYL